MAAKMPGFSWPIRVYFEDTDMAGVVYYANYLKFMERARTEWLRSLGFEQDHLKAHERRIFAVRSVEIEYLSPAVFNDALIVESRVLRAGKASISFAQEIVRKRKEGGGDVLCRGRIKIACLETDSFKPAIMPKDLLEAVKSVC